MDHGAGALPTLFMLAAGTEAAGLQFCCCPKQKNHRRVDGGSQVDAFGEFRFVPALTKLSSKRAENPMYHGPDHSIVTEQ
jgi:hypothetical protein